MYATDVLLPAEFTKFCREWHDGMWSAMYKAQCQSTPCILDAEHAECVKSEVRAVRRGCMKGKWTNEIVKADDFLQWLDEQFPEQEND